MRKLKPINITDATMSVVATARYHHALNHRGNDRSQERVAGTCQASVATSHTTMSSIRSMAAV